MNNSLEVVNIDQGRRTLTEWAKIYYIKFTEDIDNVLCGEYEWAYNYYNFKFIPVLDSNNEFESNAKMEMRAMEIKRDLFVNADMGEKMVLKEKYMDTEFVKSKLHLY